MTTMMSIGCVLNWAVPGRRLSLPSHDWTSFNFNSTQSLSFFFSSSSLKAWSNTRKWSGIAFVNSCVIRYLLLQPQVEWTRFYVSWISCLWGLAWVFSSASWGENVGIWWHSSSKVRWRKYEEGREVWPSVGVPPYLGLDCLHGELPPLRVLVLIKTFHKTKKVLKHCQRHNGPEDWVHLAKVTSWGHITNLDHILSSESRLSIN